MKKNKRGLGAEKVKKEKDKSKDVQNHSDKKDKVWCIRETHSVSKFLMCIYIELFGMGCFKFLKFKSFDLLKRKKYYCKICGEFKSQVEMDKLSNGCIYLLLLLTIVGDILLPYSMVIDV